MSAVRGKNTASVLRSGWKRRRTGSETGAEFFNAQRITTMIAYFLSSFEKNSPAKTIAIWNPAFLKPSFAGSAEELFGTAHGGAIRFFGGEFAELDRGSLREDREAPSAAQTEVAQKGDQPTGILRAETAESSAVPVEFDGEVSEFEIHDALSVPQPAGGSFASHLLGGALRRALRTRVNDLW